MGFLTQCDGEHSKGDGLTYGQGGALQREDPFPASFLLLVISRKQAQTSILWVLLSHTHKKGKECSAPIN